MEQRKRKIKCEIYRDSMQNYKKYAIPPAQLMTATNDELIKRFIAKEKAMNLAIEIVKAGGSD